MSIYHIVYHGKVMAIVKTALQLLKLNFILKLQRFSSVSSRNNLPLAHANKHKAQQGI